MIETFFKIKRVAFLGLLLTALTSARAGNSLATDLPPLVKDAIQKLVPPVKWMEFIKHQEEAGEIFNVFGETAMGDAVSAEVSAKGTVTAVEQAVGAATVSEDIQKLVGEQVPDFRPEKLLQKFEGDNLRTLKPSDCIFELSGPFKTGKNLTVEIKADGTFLWIKREILLDEVPRVLRATLSAEAPKLKPSCAVEISNQDGVTAYLLSNPKGRTAYISADGKEVLLHKE